MDLISVIGSKYGKEMSNTNEIQILQPTINVRTIRTAPFYVSDGPPIHKSTNTLKETRIHKTCVETALVFFSICLKHSSDCHEDRSKSKIRFGYCR